MFFEVHTGILKDSCRFYQTSFFFFDEIYFFLISMLFALGAVLMSLWAIEDHVNTTKVKENVESRELPLPKNIAFLMSPL